MLASGCGFGQYFLIPVGGLEFNLEVRPAFRIDTDECVRLDTPGRLRWGMLGGLIEFRRLARDGNRPGQIELNAKRHRCWSFDLFQERNTQQLSFRV